MKNIFITSLWYLIIGFSTLSFAQKRKNVAATPPTPLAPTSIEYELAMPKPQTHYFEVSMKINNLNNAAMNAQGYTDFKLPVWTPGSYLIREFAKNVEGFKASSFDTLQLKCEKVSKNSWRVYHNRASQITVKYRVYAYELSVRTSFLDESHGYLNGANVFVYVKDLKDLPATLLIKPHESFKTITTGLPEKPSNVFEAENYDILIDSPIEIGNQKVFSFEANGVPHRVAMYGTCVYDEQKLAKDMKLVCETANKVVGEYPNKAYTFIVHNTSVGSGGLEHLNSTTLNVSRLTYGNPASYQGFLSLVAHEYFHLWNVKRIRPKALGPFDYDNENYTHLLWVAEGLTTYYQTHLLQRAKILNPDQYLNRLANEITAIENTPGQRVQSLAESSWDAWIKYYRQNENSKNSIISYYDKGAVMGALLDMYVIRHTLGEKCLDDVMKYLYNNYYKKEQRGFSDEELQKAFEMVSGDYMNDFFQKYIFGTEPLPYHDFLKSMGCALVETTPPSTDGFLGADVKLTEGKIIVSSVLRDGSAWESGLNVNDEVLMIDGVRIPNTLDGYNRLMTGQKAGSSLKMSVIRDGLLKELSITLLKNPNKSFRIERLKELSEGQEKNFKKWLRE